MHVDYRKSNTDYSDSQIMLFSNDFDYISVNLYFSNFFPQYEDNVITIDLVQNSSQKTQNDVDIADVAYYFEKDVSIIFFILFLCSGM